MLAFAISIWSVPGSIAQPEPETDETGTTVEAWYYVADDAATPTPLPVIPDPVNPYGENTLHVAVTAGQEESRTYIALDLSDLPPVFELLNATLIVPIDPGGVTMNPERARVQLCLSAIPPKSTHGSFEEPPEVDCDIKTVPSYETKPFPHLRADITDFGADLAFSGLALMPSDRAKEQGDTWHLTIYGKKNEAEGAKPITAELEYVEEDLTSPVVDTRITPDLGAPPNFGSPDTGGGFDFSTSNGPALDPASAPSDDSAAAPIAADEPAEEPQLELAAETEPAYTIVWGLPLLLLALSFYFGSALTREVVLRRSLDD